MTFDAGSVSARLELDRSDFTAGLDAAKADADKFTSKPVKATVTADGTQAKATLDDLTARADKLSGKAGTIKISADASQANTEMDKTSAKADTLGKKDPTIKVKADTTAADADLAKTAAAADALGRKTETVKVNTKTDTSGIDNLSKKITELTDGPFSLLNTAVVGLGPAAVPVLGAITAAVLPLSAAIGSAAAGLAAFGTVSKAVLTQAATASTAASTAQSTYTAAIAKAAGQYAIASAAAKTHTQQVAALAAEHKADAAAAVTQAAALGKAYAGMSSQQIALSKQVGDLDTAYKGMLTSVTPLVSSALVPWIKDIQGALQYVKPLITDTAGLFKSWGTELGQTMAANAGNISRFIDAFAGRSATNIRLFGDALVEFAKGAGALIHDIAPNLAGAAGGIVKLATSFAGWAKSQKTADDIKGFFAWAKSEAPTVQKFLEELSTSVGHLIQAMAFSGGGDLKVLTVALSGIAALPTGAIVAIADGFVAISLGLRAASAAMVVYNTVATIAEGIQAALSDEVKVTGAALVIQKIATLAMAAADVVADAAETVYIALMLVADAVSAPLILVVGGIVLAIAGLTAGIYELATHWSTVWHAILAATQDVWSWIKANWPLLAAILIAPFAPVVAVVVVAVDEIIRHWGSIVGAFHTVGTTLAGDWKAFTGTLLAPIAAIVHGISVAWAAIEAPFAAVLDWIKTHWQDTLVLLTGLLGVAILVIIHFWPQITAAVTAVFNAIASFFTSWWATETARFTAAADVLKTVLSAAWSAISTALKAAWNAVAAFFTSWWNTEVAYFKGPIAAIENALKAAWSAITSVAKSAWGAIASYFSSWWNTELSTFKNDVNAIGSALHTAWTAIETTAKSVFGGILTYFGGWWSALKSGFAAAVSGIGTAWTKLENIVKVPVQWVITHVYDDLIVKFWNATAGAIGLTKLPKLAGGGMVPGGYSPVDNQLVWMRSGEGVLQPGAVMALGGPAFIDAANRAYGDVPVGSSGAGYYAAGGTRPTSVGQGLHTGTTADPSGSAPAGLGSVGGIISGIVHDAAGVISEVENGVFDVLASVGTRLIDDAVKLIPGTGGVATAMRDYPPKIWSAFLSWVTAHAGNGGDIVKYAESFLGKIPYVWGGTSLSSVGADCSGFTGSVLSHFGYNPPRSSEAQGSWVKRSGPQAGGLAFYHSPAGGPDPGHVAIVASGSQVVSQGGGMGPKMMALHAMPLLWTGIPPGGFKSGSGGGAVALAGGGSASANQALGQKMAAAMGWTGAEWAALNAVEMMEAGWSTTAKNPSSGAYGIAQFISGPSEYAQYGGNSSTAGGQIAGFLNYIKERYGDPEAALRHENCVPLSVDILTRRGWLSHNQIRQGDETVGFDPETGRSAWTPITQVHVYDDAPLVRLTNKTWEAVCTPQHRWAAVHWKHTGRKGQGGRTKLTKNEFTRENVMVETQRITTRHSLRLSAEADTGNGPAIDDREAELLGWVLGDGSVAHLKRHIKNPDHWKSGTGSSVSIRLYQSKPEHVAAIDELVKGMLFSRMTRRMRGPSGEFGLPLVTWQFTRAYSAELLKRSGYDHKNPVPFVLSLSPGQREAFMRGVFGAEGSHAGNGTFKGVAGYPLTKVYPQNDGPQQDAIILGVYLSGYRPGISELDNRGKTIGRWTVSTIAAIIRETKPFIGGERIKREDAGRGPVYCVTTGLGTWTMRQGRHVMLTGNSYGWYDQGGWLQPGITMAINNTGRPEPILTGDQWDSLSSAVAGGDGIGDKLDRIANLLAAQPRATASGVAGALNGTAQMASFRSRYPRSN